VALRVTLRNGSADPDEGRIVATLPIPAHAASAIRLRIAINDPKYGFDYAFGSGQWHTLLADADSSVLASERTNQFTGLVVGPYAMRGAAP
jgi:beta-xylosidase